MPKKASHLAVGGRAKKEKVVFYKNLHACLLSNSIFSLKKSTSAHTQLRDLLGVTAFQYKSLYCVD